MGGGPVRPPRQSMLMLAAVFATVFVVFGSFGAWLAIGNLATTGSISPEEASRWSGIAFFGLIVVGYVAFWFVRRRIA
jgi:hypothetical protein